VHIDKEEIIDKVIAILTESGGSLRLLDISKQMQFKSDSAEYEILVEVLRVLVEQGVVEKSSRRRYSLVPNTIMTPKPIGTNKPKNNAYGLIGIFHLDIHSGYVTTDDKEYPVIIIPGKFRNTAIDGDCVRVKLANKNNKKKIKGEIVDIIERGITNITGSIEFDGNFYFLVPDNEQINVDFLVPTNDLAGARSGDKVKAIFTKWENSNANPQAKVTEIIGRSGDPIVEYEAIVKEFNLPTEFPEEVIKEVAKFSEPTNKKPTDRLDLRNETIITIDPITARDFDDALSLKQLENGNYQLGVHIADVSHYVKEGTELDKEALKRGNSTYLTDRVIPMLPEKLSNEICSLSQDNIRYTFSAIMEIDSDTEVVSYQIVPSMIKSNKRFNYDEVQNIIDTATGECADLILQLSHIASRLRSKRIANGSINYDTREIKYILNEDKFPIDVEIHQTTDSTSLVEECMLLANKTVAQYIKVLSEQVGIPNNSTLPFIYRVHDEPQKEALAGAIAFIRSMGVSVHTNNVTPSIINEILEVVKYKPINAVINQMLIRAMSKAIYSPVNIGHFGLGFKDYTHFTSPIRRYSDLLVHRLLKEYSNGKPEQQRLHKLTSVVSNVSQHTSETERHSMDAERASTKLTSAIYAQTMIGSIFKGTISGVVQYGLYIILDGLYSEGLLHIKDMDDDHYTFEERKMCLVGKHTHQKFTLGDKVNVQIVKVDIQKRTIDLIMV
jgi:ribonuclease R